jgi:hypothetical protein
MERPLRSGTFTCDGRYFETGSLSATSPRPAMSESNSDVKTFVTDAMSKRVSPSNGRESP